MLELKGPCIERFEQYRETSLVVMEVVQVRKINFRHGTHVGTLKSIIKIFQPYSIVEFGMGYFSTRLLSDSCESFISFETQGKWLKECKTDKGEYIRYKIRLSRRIQHMTEEKMDEVMGFYSKFTEHFKSMKSPSMAFIDNDACLRVPAAVTILPFIDIMVIHDTPGENNYGYSKIFEKVDYDNFIHLRNKSFEEGTDCLIKKPLFNTVGMTEFVEQIKKYDANFMRKSKNIRYLPMFSAFNGLGVEVGL